MTGKLEAKIIEKEFRVSQRETPFLFFYVKIIVTVQYFERQGVVRDDVVTTATEQQRSQYGAPIKRMR